MGSYVRTPLKSYVRGLTAITATSLTTSGAVTVGGRTTSAGFSSSIDGDATTPAYNWSGDTNIGVFRVAADQLRIAVGGTAQIDLSTSAVTSLNHLQNNGTLFQVGGNISMTAGMNIVIANGYIALDEITAAPSAVANRAFLYSIDLATKTQANVRCGAGGTTFALGVEA